MSHTSVQFRLRDVLNKHCTRTGSWHALEQAIQEANGGSGHAKIDRRKLKKLCDTSDEVSHSVSLSVGEFIALDTYLLRHNEGLAEQPLFRRPVTLLDSVVESPVVHFFVAARFSERRETEVISRWDMRTITRLMRTDLLTVRMNIWDIHTRENWTSLAATGRARGEAKISVGSPRTCHASEFLMAEMAGVQPFEHGPLDELPFFILDGRDHRQTLPSAFIREPGEFAQIDGMTPVVRGNERAIVAGKHVFTTSGATEDLALLVAQRHPTEKQVHMVLNGLSGPATYALAKALQRGQINQALPPLKDETHPPILAVVLRVHIGQRGNPVGGEAAAIKRERRQVLDFKPVRAMLLHRSEGRWRE